MTEVRIEFRTEVRIEFRTEVRIEARIGSSDRISDRKYAFHGRMKNGRRK